MSTKLEGSTRELPLPGREKKVSPEDLCRLKWAHNSSNTSYAGNFFRGIYIYIYIYVVITIFSTKSLTSNTQMYYTADKKENNIYRLGQLLSGA